MRKLTKPLALTLLVLSAPSLLAQSSTVLTTLWEVRVGSNDYMTTEVPSERDQHTVRGAVVYVPDSNISGTSALHRLNNGFDHMLSTSTNEGGYSFEGTV